MYLIIVSSTPLNTFGVLQKTSFNKFIVQVNDRSKGSVIDSRVKALDQQTHVEIVLLIVRG